MDYRERIGHIACHLLDLTSLFHGLFRWSSEGGKAGKTTIQRYCLLKHLQEVGELSLKALGGLMGFKKNTLSELVDRMVKDGQIGRRVDDRDRRRISLKILPLGLKTAQDFEQQFRDRMETALQNLSSEDRTRFVEALDQILDISTGLRGQEGCR